MDFNILLLVTPNLIRCHTVDTVKRRLYYIYICTKDNEKLFLNSKARFEEINEIQFLPHSI